jgi:hypothetical protein
MNHFPLEPIEKASIDELRGLQLKRLQCTLRHAYANSPVYRRKFDEAGVHPDDCRTLADLAKFPFTTKHDLRDSYPFGMFAVPREQCAQFVDAGFLDGFEREVVHVDASSGKIWPGITALLPRNMAITSPFWLLTFMS